LEQRTHRRRSRRRVTASMGQAFNAFKLLGNGYIVHPPLFGVKLASTLLRDDRAIFGLFIPPRAATFLFRRFTPLQSTHARSGRVETVSLEFKRACAPDFERHRSLPDM
jgi:hypothetical protein